MTSDIADTLYADIAHLVWPIIDTDTDIYVHFFSTPYCRDDQVSSVVEFTYNIMHTLCVGSPANAGKKCKAENDVIFILCGKRRKILELQFCKTCHIYLRQLLLNKSDTSCFKLNDALPETIITIPTTRANLVCFTSDKVRKHHVCPQ